MSNIIQSLWIGTTLSKIEQLSIKSFIDNGHEYHLYVYNPIKNIPKGVIIKDANEILPENEIFTYESGSYSAFANYFRFTLLYKKGGYWVDTDLVCIKKFQFKEPIVIASEPVKYYTRKAITSFLIKLPKGSKEALRGIEIQKEHKVKILKGEIKWASGNKTVIQLVNEFNLHKYIIPWINLCSCSWTDTKSLIDRNFKCKGYNDINKLHEEIYGIHLWNEVWRREGIDKNGIYPNDCLFEQLKLKYNISN